MTKEHFNELTEKYYFNYTQQEKDFLFKLAQLFDEYEESTHNSVVLHGSISFPYRKDLVWRGDIFA